MRELLQTKFSESFLIMKSNIKSGGFSLFFFLENFKCIL